MERAAAAEQLADGGKEPPDSMEQLEERVTAHVEAEIASQLRGGGAAGLNARMHGTLTDREQEG